MQVSGRLLVLSTFAIGLTMAVGAWWYNRSQSMRAAQFWGKQDAQLIVGAETVELLTLIAADEAAADDYQPRVAGRAIASRFDLSKQRGLVHLRHALTFDDNFTWDALDRDASAEGWRRALRFAQGNRELVVLFPEDFGRLGRIAADDRIEALPCPRLGPSITEYLGRVGAPGFAPAQVDAEGGAR
jgi:hypothetical protein